ncbi:hypothetical protein [Mycobacterium sp. ACS1612]|uniref:hypothetical protein n=1 Tax=Mycobacterium sp. ACS1612 TaxID=1834117 RepID=UPI0009EEE891|nr:hypothetical protein [Mycobacterium sp. ACS1612]
MLRSAVFTLAGVLALQVPQASAAPAATGIVTVAAVSANGEPAGGYQVVNRQGSPNLSVCPGPSPAAVAPNIYSCEPAQAAAEVCWPASAFMLCLADPWSRGLRRFAKPGALPAVDPPPVAMPFALQLDDGTRCILPNGIDWGARADDMVPVYGCNPGKTSMGVLVAAGEDALAAIDRSGPVWVVRVGELGPRDTPFESPRRRAVATAWFAGN